MGAIGAVSTAWMIASAFVPVKRRAAGQHLVGDDAKRPEIRPCVHRFTRRLFRRHVAGRAHRAALARELRRRLVHLDFREPEVEDLHLSRRRQHQVRRFEIAVHDAGGVCGGERIGDLCDDASDLGHRQRSAGEASRQRLALVMRHRDERLAGVFADLVDRRDVRMIERAGRARLPQQAGRRVWIAGRSRRQELERDPSLEVRYPRRDTPCPCRPRRCG